MKSVPPPSQLRLERDELPCLAKGKNVSMSADIVELERDRHTAPRGVALAEATREVCDEVPLKAKRAASCSAAGHLEGDNRLTDHWAMIGSEGGRRTKWAPLRPTSRASRGSILPLRLSGPGLGWHNVFGSSEIGRTLPPLASTLITTGCGRPCSLRGVA
jgi:hypothetical protein